MDKKPDPLKPEQPEIPGVPAAAAKSPPAAEPRREYAATDQPPQTSEQKTPAGRAHVRWIAIGAIVALVAGVALWHHILSSTAVSQGVDSTAPELSAGAAEARSQDKNLPIGPGIVGKIGDLSQPWSSKRFLFRGPMSPDPVPAMVVRLPSGDYWGFSLQEPFGTCELEYVTDLQKLAADYNFRGDHPMVGDPCTHTVYDLLRYSGGSPEGGLVRGEIVRGVGVRPPLAIEIRIEGDQVRAVRME